MTSSTIELHKEIKELKRRVEELERLLGSRPATILWDCDQNCARCERTACPAIKPSSSTAWDGMPGKWS